MEKFSILNKESVNNCDPHSYFSDVGRQDIDFKNPTKRSFLSECIREIHEMNGTEFPIVKTNPVKYNKRYILNTLNTIMIPPKLSIEEASIERVKRRLFLEKKGRPRKNSKPIFNDRPISECLYFKPYRDAVGIRKIPRNYLERARDRIYDDIRQNLKRKHFDEDDETEENFLHFNTNEGAFDVSQQFKRERNRCGLSRKAKKLEEMLVEQQYRERFMFNGKIAEASIRSILYMKTLLGLITGETDGRNPDNPNI